MSTRAATRSDVAVRVLGVVVVVGLVCLSCLLALMTSVLSEAPMNHGRPEAGLLLPAGGLLFLPLIGSMTVYGARRGEHPQRWYLPSARVIWLTALADAGVITLLVVIWLAAVGPG